MVWRLHPERLRGGNPLDLLGLLIDVFMILLVIVNLALIVFDALFALSWVQQQLESATPAFFQFYNDTIHADFFYYDLWFVAIYLTEFMIRWIVAIARGTYHRWFFFPFVHWYDLLGCIPVGGFRWLRTLRIVSLLLRLQRIGVIDMRETYLGATLVKYYKVLVEEISDRVVLNVLDGVQREIRQGNPLMHRIQTEVLQPRQHDLVDYAAGRLIAAAEATHADYREPLGHYLSRLTDDALANTRSGARLAAIPVAGPRAIALIGDAVRDVGVALLDQLIKDIAHPDHRDTVDRLLNDLIEHAAGDSEQLNALVRDTLLDIIEQIKAQVAVQNWKLEEERAEAERRARKKARPGTAPDGDIAG